MMQMCYNNMNGEQHIFRLTKLHDQVELLLTNELYMFGGVNVTEDIHTFGRDFNLSTKTDKRVQNRVIILESMRL